ncbi:MAG: hypothetical protein QM778_07295 [Myxococcales bacterium]
MQALALTPDQRRYLLLEHCLLPALVNLVFNAAIGWLIFRHALPVRMWPELSWPGILQPNFAGDVSGMFFFLPLVTCLAVTRFVVGAVREGKVALLAIRRADHPILRHLPVSVWPRAILMGSLCSVVLGSLVVLILTLMGVNSLSLGFAVGLKGLLAALLAAVATPVMAVHELCLEK